MNTKNYLPLNRYFLDLNVKNNYEECLFYKPMSYSADFIKDAKVNFRTQSSLNKFALRVLLNNIKSNLT